MNVSLIYASFKRPQLLDLTLWSLSQQVISHNLEIIVVIHLGLTVTLMKNIIL
jgi:hypothetical protein